MMNPLVLATILPVHLTICPCCPREMKEGHEVAEGALYEQI
jgi:hypothetical protein